MRRLWGVWIWSLSWSICDLQFEVSVIASAKIWNCKIDSKLESFQKRQTHAAWVLAQTVMQSGHRDFTTKQWEKVKFVFCTMWCDPQHITNSMSFTGLENFVLVPHQSLAYTHFRAMDKELGDNSLRTKPVSFNTELRSRLWPEKIQNLWLRLYYMHFAGEAAFEKVNCCCPCTIPHQHTISHSTNKKVKLIDWIVSDI